MFLRLLLSLIFLCLNLSACQNTPDAQEELESQYDEVQAKIDALKREKLQLILERLYDKKLFNGIVSVQHQGKLLFEQGFGVEDFRAEKPRKITSKSCFRIASISQQFTATAIMLLVQRGKINYQAPVSQFFPEINYPQLTIQHLLTHSSGLPDYLEQFYTKHPDMFTYATNQNILNWLINQKPALDFSPGEEWAFSNTNYVLLAEIVRKVAKKTLPDFLRLEVFKPLKMQYSKIPKPHKDRPIPNRVYGFNTDQQSLNDDNFLNKVYGDKGIYTCIDDLKKWNKAIDEHKLLNPEVQKHAFEAVKLNNARQYPYGFGWHLDAQNPQRYYNFGGWLGFQGAFIKNRQTKTCILILSNNHSPIFQQIVKLVDNITHGRAYEIPSEALSR